MRTTRCLIALLAVIGALALAPIAQGGGGAEVTPCADYDPELTGVGVVTPSGRTNLNCNPPGPAEPLPFGDGPGAVTGLCSDLRPGETGRFVYTPSGHEKFNCQSP